jgi:hypothetical protein
MHASTPRLAAIAIALFAGIAHAGVFGTMTGASAASAERKYDAATLKPADLKSCVVDAYSIDTSDALFEAMRPKIEEERSELERLREAARGKPTNESAAAESAMRVKAQAFNAKVAALNGRVAYAQDARDRFSKACKGRKYFFEDLAGVRSQLPPEIAEAIPR